MKTLVTYFSASGVTKRKAQILAKSLAADTYEILPEDLYTSEDLDWTNSRSRSSLEMKNPALRPALQEKSTDLGVYDTVYIGFPIWWGIAPRIINTFMESNDFSGKKVVVFATSGGSRVEPAARDLQKKYPKLQIECGKLL